MVLVHLYMVHRWLDTLPFYLYYELLVQKSMLSMVTMYSDQMLIHHLSTYCTFINIWNTPQMQLLFPVVSLLTHARTHTRTHTNTHQGQIYTFEKGDTTKAVIIIDVGLASIFYAHNVESTQACKACQHQGGLGACPQEIWKNYTF